VTGIGLGWGDVNVTYGSFLLFMANLVGITLAASLTFLVLGYAPIHRAKKGIIYTLVTLLFVSIPLAISFNKAIEQNDIMVKLDNYTFEHKGKKLLLHVLQVDLSGEKPEIFLQTGSSDLLNKDDLMALKNKVCILIQKDVTLKISSNIIVN
jgi:hypothetical protein